MNSNNRHRHAGHTTRPRSSPRLAHVALRHAGGPHSTSGRPPAPNACTRPQNPQHGGRTSVRGVRVRSRTHRAATALRACSARVPPPQHREGIGPTPTNRRNHTSARPQHVHTGRREGREATGGYAHRCEVVAPLALASGPARTCRAQGRRGSTARACRPYTPNRPHTARVSSRPVRRHRLGRREPLRVATHRRLAPLGARCRRVPAAPHGASVRRGAARR